MKAGFWEILLIVVLILILFGHAKIPSLMKNLANGINIFKKELKNVGDKEKPEIIKNTVVKKPITKKQVIKKKAGSVKKSVKKTK